MLKLPIIFENTHAVIINKPASLIVHPDEKTDEYTVASWMHDVYGNHLPGEEGREGVVHRLDRNTTGVLVLAKDEIAYTSFKKQFRDHTVRKVYRAIVEGNIKHDTGMISAPLARAKSDFRKRTIVDPFSQDNRGEEREAITRYKVLERSTYNDKPYTYVEVYPLTGRTHQIRAHFRGIRHPIIGDELYGSLQGKALAERSMLHALKITLSVPEDQEGSRAHTFTADVPKDMQEILKKLNFKENLTTLD